jgi:hypothetical protein
MSFLGTFSQLQLTGSGEVLQLNPGSLGVDLAVNSDGSISVGNLIVSLVGTTASLDKNQRLFGEALVSSLTGPSSYRPINLLSSGTQYRNDLAHDHNTAIEVQQWTANGAGMVVANGAGGDGIFIQTTDDTTQLLSSTNASGTFYLQSFQNSTYTSIALPGNATAGQVQTALQGITGFGAATAYGGTLGTETIGMVLPPNQTVTVSNVGLGQAKAQVLTAYALNVFAGSSTYDQAVGAGVHIQRYGLGQGILAVAEAGSGTFNPLMELDTGVDVVSLFIDDTGSEDQDTLSITVVQKQSGSVLSIYHAGTANATATMTGHAIRLDMGNHSSPFVGAFLKCLNQGQEVCVLNYSGGLALGGFSGSAQNNDLWMNSGVPGSSDGVAGDFCFDTASNATHRLYYKISSVAGWTSVV